MDTRHTSIDQPMVDVPYLKPCPFCGHALAVKARKSNPYARCATEGCKGKQLPLLNLDMPEDVAAWNRRADEACPVVNGAEPEKASDRMSADLLISQLAELHHHYEHLQMLDGQNGDGPLDKEALPVPAIVLERAADIRSGRISKELDAVRLLLRLLWQGYDAGGTSCGRSFDARIVEAAIMLLGQPVAQFDVSRGGMELVQHCEDRAYEITRVAQIGEQWDAAVRRFRDAQERRHEIGQQHRPVEPAMHAQQE
ncbi:hypothetical protein [Paraburkholderia sp. SIMBA_054]|uniref:hypothetical protein n=1 Tax=Paraburkholderia sp. SIMBA_054 TaxID=3085795 RepID=UPI0039780830